MNDLLERLAAADPARDWQPDAAARTRLWAHVAVTLADEPRRRARRWSRRSATLALAAAFAVTGGALAATNVIRFGAPAKQPGAFSDPHRGLGAILPHSVRMLPITAPDPDGGLNWGMRVLSTTRGVGCIQVGRTLNGRLWIVGRDHAFGNDGRLHEIPANSLFNPGGCTPLDANGRIFLTVGMDYMPASGMPSCEAGGFTRGGPPTNPICKPASERSLYYGVLGPEARSVTYKLGERTIVRNTVGPEGAFLIVTRATKQHRCDCVTPGLLPWTSPITSIKYADGTICHLPGHGRPYPADACVPHGYVAPKQAVPAPGDVATPVHVRVLHGGSRRRRVIEISFRARIAVTNARSGYAVSWSTGDAARQTYLLLTQGDIKAGEVIRKRLPVDGSGAYRGTVRYVSSQAPAAGPLAARPNTGVVVGHFAVRIAKVAAADPWRRWRRTN